MTDIKIGKLRRVKLREVWKHEAHDFTTWLEKNIAVLNEELDFSLVDVQREHQAGSFNIDMLAKDEKSDRTVIIENQFEKSNHDHLGKILTYMTAVEAEIAIWIVETPRPEHVAAIAWLNRSTEYSFYMIKVEAVRIDDSPAAPLMTLIVGPSEDAEDIKQTKEELTERHHLRKEWWEQIVVTPGASLHKHLTPGIASWLGAKFHGLNLNYVVTQNDCSAELYIDKDKETGETNKKIFDQLFKHKADIEKAFGVPLKWERLDNRRASRVRFTVEGGYRSPQEEWPAIQKKIVAAMDHLSTALDPHLSKIKA